MTEREKAISNEWIYLRNSHSRQSGMWQTLCRCIGRLNFRCSLFVSVSIIFEGLGNIRNATQTLIFISHSLQIQVFELRAVWHIIWCVGCRYYRMGFDKYSTKQDSRNRSKRLHLNENAILIWWWFNWKWKPSPLSIYFQSPPNKSDCWIFILTSEFFLIAKMKIYFGDLFFSVGIR